MKTVLLRTGSGSLPVQTPVIARSVSTHESIGKVFNGKKKKGCCSPVISLNLEANRRCIRRTSSEPDVIRTLSKIGSRSLPAIIPEEDCGSELNESEVLRSIGSLNLTEDRQSYAGDWPRDGIPELGFPGGGIGKNRKFGGSGGGRDEYNADSSAGENTDPKKIGAYYKEMLNSDPMNPLFLRNYGKYLHEVLIFIYLNFLKSYFRIDFVNLMLTIIEGGERFCES